MKMVKQEPVFIGSKWTLETDIIDDRVYGCITDAISAKTYTFVIGITNRPCLWGQKTCNCGIPRYVIRQLGKMMRKVAKEISSDKDEL
jgi:hypothetical protein